MARPRRTPTASHPTRSPRDRLHSVRTPFVPTDDHQRVDGRAVGDLYVDSGPPGGCVPTGGIGVPPITVVALDTGRPVFTALTGQVGTTVTPGYRIRVVTTITNQPIPNVALYFWNGTPENPVTAANRSCRRVPADSIQRRHECGLDGQHGRSRVQPGSGRTS